MGILFLNYRQAKIMMVINMFWEHKMPEGEEMEWVIQKSLHTSDRSSNFSVMVP